MIHLKYEIFFIFQIMNNLIDAFENEFIKQYLF